MTELVTNREGTVTFGDRTFYIEPGHNADRLPWLLPLAEGWDWYRFQDGVYSSRFVTNGGVWRCTDCGYEGDSPFCVRRHNHPGTCPAHTEGS